MDTLWTGVDNGSATPVLFHPVDRPTRIIEAHLHCATLAAQILWSTHAFDKECAVVGLVAASYMPWGITRAPKEYKAIPQDDEL